MNQQQEISAIVRRVSSLLLARGNPFSVPPPELRRRDATRSLSPDARRALANRAAAEAPSLVNATNVVRDDMPLAYPTRPRVDLCTGVELSASARKTAQQIWAWPGPAGLEEFYRHYPFLRPDSPIEEHFAERRFLTDIVIPVLGEAGLQRLEAQLAFTDLSGHERRADFVLHGAKDYALEVEGRVHDSANMVARDFEDEKLRQRSLAAAGFVYEPFVYSEIARGAALLQFEQLCRADATLAPLVVGSADKVRAPISRSDPSLSLVTQVPVLLRQLHLVALAMIADAGTDELIVRAESDDLGLVAMAFADVLALLRAAAGLEGLPQAEYRVRLLYPEHWGVERSCLPDFFGNPNWAADHTDRRIDATTPPHVLDIELSDNTDRGEARSILLRPDWPPSQLESLASKILTPPTPTVSSAPAAVEPPRWALDTFARWFFPEVAALRDEQFNVIRDLMMGKSKMVVLPTAGGKSLCYQLPALLRDGAVLVVSPLRALMHDQLEGLRSCGIAVATSITVSDRGDDAKAAKLRKVERGEVRLLYVAPERLLIRSFVQEVAVNAARWGLWAIAVDEAHCVSEWGHDFRPSYLHIAKFRRELERHRPVATLALTGTASALVRQDVMNVLGIANIEQPKSSDREEISFSVHKVEKTGRHDALGAHLVDELPAILRKSPKELYRHSSERHGVVVFAPFADPHGATTHDLGVAAVRRQLISSGRFAASEVRVHASQPVMVCPNDGSPNYASNGNAYKCRDCSHSFSEPVQLMDGEWLEAVTETQNAFKANDFPVLVATKGYGMGIDKPNIRGIVHASFASGLESYYQEVGRAARDGAHGHASLFFSAPADECVQRHLLGAVETSEPPCVSEPRYYQWWKCPYLPYVCDYGHQARFIKGSYPGEAVDLKQAMAAFDELQGSSAADVKRVTRGDRDLNAEQLALYRLMSIGYVKDYAIEYGDRGAMLHITKADDWSADAARASALQHLVNLVPSADKKPAMGEMRARVEAIRANTSRELVEQLVGLLLRYTYLNVKGMRYNMLKNQLDYATNSGGRPCRRSYLRGVFDDIAKDEPCGFCDLCVSDRRFRRKRARRAVVDSTLAQLSRSLPEMVQRFGPEELSDAAAVAEERGAIEGLQTRAEHLLESEPNNQSLLLLAAEAASRRGVHASALAHLADATAANEAFTRDRERARLYYQKAQRLSPSAAISLVERRRGMFDDPEGHRFLLSELESTTSDDAERISRVRAVIACDELEQVFSSERFTALRNELGALEQELAI